MKEGTKIIVTMPGHFGRLGVFKNDCQEDLCRVRLDDYKNVETYHKHFVSADFQPEIYRLFFPEQEKIGRWRLRKMISEAEDSKISGYWAEFMRELVVTKA